MSELLRRAKDLMSGHSIIYDGSVWQVEKSDLNNQSGLIDVTITSYFAKKPISFSLFPEDIVAIAWPAIKN